MWKKQIETFRNVAFCFTFCQHLSMDKKTAHKIAIKIVEDMEGPLGRIPIGRVVEKHIAFFNELRSEGASWPQISDLLADAGLTRKDGKPMAASQLRATVSRINAQKSTTSQTQQSKPLRAAVYQPKKTLIPPQNHNNATQTSLPKQTVQSIRDKMKTAKAARK